MTTGPRQQTLAGDECNTNVHPPNIADGKPTVCCYYDAQTSSFGVWRRKKFENLEQTLNNLLFIDPFSLSFVVTHNTVTQYIVGNSLHILYVG